jgi:hypothetical protein
VWVVGTRTDATRKVVLTVDLHGAQSNATGTELRIERGPGDRRRVAAQVAVVVAALAVLVSAGGFALGRHHDTTVAFVDPDRSAALPSPASSSVTAPSSVVPDVTPPPDPTPAPDPTPSIGSPSPGPTAPVPQPSAPGETIPTGRKAPGGPGPGPGAPDGSTCSGDRLEVGLEPAGVATGHSFVLVVFTNRSSAACTLAGTPTIELLDASNNPAGPGQRDAGGAAAPVTLGPGESAHSLLDDTATGNIGSPRCGPVNDALRLVVVPPGTDFRFSFSAVEAEGNGLELCTNDVGQISVRPVHPGRERSDLDN